MSKVMNIDRNKLCNLLDLSLNYVIDEKEEDIAPVFYDSIDKNENNCFAFINELKCIRTVLKEDLKFFLDSDPAADSTDEIRIAYPGFRAIAIYRVSHVLYKLGYKVHARFFSEIGHSMTGIDIHPAANIDYPLFIDHGTGIVVGQTSSIGKNVKIYQCVTLGALSLSNARELRGVIRHPQVGNNVTIYAGASLLGAITIGDNVTIGSNVFLTENVPSNTRVVIGKPELIIKSK